MLLYIYNYVIGTLNIKHRLNHLVEALKKKTDLFKKKNYLVLLIVLLVPQ